MRDKETFVVALERGLAVLGAFKAHTPEMSISDVAAAAGVSPAAARRSLLTLVQLGYMGQHDGKFLLRPRVLELGAAFLESQSVATILQSYLEELREHTGDSAAFTVLDGPDIVHVLHLPTKRIVREAIHPGGRSPAYLVPTGRAMLAHLPAAQLEDYLANLTVERPTENTVQDIGALRQILADVKKQGYAVVVNELEYGLTGVAVPVFDGSGRAIAGLGCVVTVPVSDLSEVVAQRLPPLRKISQEISGQFSRYPTLATALLT